MSYLVFTGPSQRDLSAVYSYVSTSSEYRAKAFIDRIIARCELLAEVPGMGRLRPEIGDDVRSFAVNPIVVFYRYHQARDVVEVLRVIDGRRDLGTIFPEDV